MGVVVTYNLGVWQREETIPIYAEFYDTDGDLADPSTHIKVTAKDPTGGVTGGVDAQTMTKDSTGKYHYNFTSGADVLTGEWTGFVEGKSGSIVSRQPFTFVMEAV